MCRADACGCGINVAPLDWVRKNYNGEIWKVLIRWEWMVGVCVPYNTDGKIRCERVELVEVVKGEQDGHIVRRKIAEKIQWVGRGCACMEQEGERCLRQN